MKVLVGVDGSPGSFEAIRQIGALLSAERDRVVLYYAPPTIRVGNDAKPDSAVVKTATQSVVDAVMTEAKQRLPVGLQATVEFQARPGRAAEQLTLLADELGVDLIVVGARGLGAMRAVLLGSVSRAVVHSACVPVLVCRPWRPAADQASPRVLVACSCDQADAPLAELACRLTWPSGTEGRPVTVIEPLFAGTIPAWLAERPRSPEVETMAAAWRAEHERERQNQQTALVRFAETLPSVFQRLEPLVLVGHAGEQLVEAARQQQADLVIVGVRPCGTMARLLLGSTSDNVLNHAPCSVLIVPKK